MRAGFADAGLTISNAEARHLLTESAGYCESLLRRLGALRADSMDISGYENCTVVHNLNEPLPRSLRQRYGLVLDGGTLEHVFDYPTAVRNALDAVRVGGHFAAIAPVNGYAGHGFYQLSPELFYRVLSPANGFRMVCALLKPLHWRSQWRAGSRSGGSTRARDMARCMAYAAARSRPAHRSGTAARTASAAERLSDRVGTVTHGRRAPAWRLERGAQGTDTTADP